MQWSFSSKKFKKILKENILFLTIILNNSFMSETNNNNLNNENEKNNKSIIAIFFSILKEINFNEINNNIN
jgi:hypothetical protein